MRIARKRVSSWVLLVVGLVTGGHAAAQTSKYPWDEYEKRIESAKQAAALKSDLFGDQVNLANGGLSFSATDVSIPGNNTLPVGISRSYSVQNRYGGPTSPPVTDQMMADWDIDAPSISGSFASNWQSSVPGNPGRRCSAPAHQASPPSPVWDINVWDFWQGNILNVPGAGGELLQVRPGAYLPTTGGPYYWMTTGQAYVSCLPTIKNTTGEGFLAITPDGTKYWFDWMAQYREPNLSSANGGSNIARRKNVLYATKVQDRFGNTVEYTYTNAWNAPGRLTGIISSDGRQLAIGYNAQGHISTVTQGARTWTYQYTALGTRRSLSAVIQPDGSQWTIGFSAFTSAELYYPIGNPAEPTRDCFVRFGPPFGPTTATGTVKHPSGALGTFTVGWLTHGRSNVPVACQNFDWGGEYGTNTNDDTNQWAISYEAYSLTKKTITGPGLTAAEWNYSYTPNISFQFYPGGSMMTPCPMGTMCGEPICTSDACAGRAETVVLGPDGERTKYFHGNSYRYNEGKLLRVERGSTAMPLMDVQVSTFDLSMAPQVYPERFGYSLRENFDGFMSEYHRPLLTSTTTRDGVDFKYEIDVFDSLARPKQVRRFSSVAGGQVKTEQTDYYDNPSLWVLGQTQKLVVNGLEVTESGFDALARPSTLESFNRLVQTLTYYADGTVATFKDGNNNVTTASNWKRGIPQSIKYPATPEAPAGALESAVVNDSGWITSTTDENGSKTCYAHDAMGRISQVTYPSESASNTCDTTTWASTTLVFQPVASVEYGVPAGHWRQTISTGNARKITYYDALWRPLVTREYDAANETVTKRFQRFIYDHDGRTTFASYPGMTDVLSTGTWTEYDALGRITSSTQDSELGALTTLTTYAGDSVGPYTRVTNPRGVQTVTRYQMFDQPTYDFPVLIDLAQNKPERAAVDITRDVFGKPTSIRKRNNANTVSVTRSYAYNAQQELCRSVEPETGATLMGYDGGGNLAWSAAGLPASTACETTGTSATVAPRRVARTYNSMNRLTSLAFPDGRGNQSWEYWPDGLPYKITTHNDGLNAGIVENTYAYNKRRMLTGESSTQSGWYTWGLGYAYDANGSLSTQTYPTGLAISYAPNALGQATEARDQSGYAYASGASFYPNGAVKQFTYGNGLLHTMTQNARQLPDRVTGSGLAMDFSYRYDANGNVSQIYDHVPDMIPGVSPKYRLMEYDGLDRLTAAGSAMFGGDHWHRLTYDAIDNLKSWTLGGVKDYAAYVYDGKNQLGSIKNTSGATIVGFGYDLQGNVNNKNGQLYNFDFGNRLRDVVGKEWYRYDGHGRRVVAGRAADHTLSIYSQSGQVLYQEDGSRAIASENIYFAGSLIALRERAYSGSTYDVKYQHTDALGSPIAVTNQAGTVIERNDYEPYGSVIGKPNYQGIGYTGHVQDGLTKLTYMQQRYYDPQVGLFLSVDPVTAYSKGDTRYFNRYWYAASNPYKYTDPDGRVLDIVADIGFIAYSGYKLATEPSWTNAAALGADVVGAVVPFATGLGAGVRAAGHGVDAVRTTSNVADSASPASSAVQGLNLEKSLASEAQTARVMAGEGEVIAGAGTKTELRAADRLSSQYGGNAGDWSKVSGGNHVAKDGTKIETHAYQNSATGQVVEPKTKLRDEGK